MTGDRERTEATCPSLFISVCSLLWGGRMKAEINKRHRHRASRQPKKKLHYLSCIHPVAHFALVSPENAASGQREDWQQHNSRLSRSGNGGVSAPSSLSFWCLVPHVKSFPSPSLLSTRLESQGLRPKLSSFF